MCSNAISIAGTLPDELKPYRPNEVMSANSRVSTATAASNAANKKSIARRDIAIHGVLTVDTRFPGVSKVLHLDERKGAAHTFIPLISLGRRMRTILAGGVVNRSSLVPRP